jgi:hypothetical protein
MFSQADASRAAGSLTNVSGSDGFFRFRARPIPGLLQDYTDMMKLPRINAPGSVPPFATRTFP